MSLAIPVDTVVAVMLRDGRHYVIENSFKIDSFEFMHGDDLQLGRGTVEGVSTTVHDGKTRTDCGSRVRLRTFSL